MEVTVLDIRCDLCRKKFITRNLYQWHNCFIKNKANCKKCGRYFAKKQKLFDHFIQCPLPFIDFPKIEIPELPLERPETSAAAPPVNNTRKRGLSKDASHVTESELIIKSESNEIEGCKDTTDNDLGLIQNDLPELQLHNEIEPEILQSVAAPELEIQHENPPTKSSKKSKKKAKKAPKVKSLKILIKKETTGDIHDRFSIQPEEEEDELSYVPQEESFVDVTSDEECVNPTIATSGPYPILIKQEKLNPEYGDIPNEDSLPDNFSNILSGNRPVKQEAETVEISIDHNVLVNIKTEKPDKPEKRKKSASKKPNKKIKTIKAANFAALAMKIKKEKEDIQNSVVQPDSTAKKPPNNINPKAIKKRSLKINPLASAKKAKATKKVKNPLARLKSLSTATDALALKIKKETPKHPKPAAIKKPHLVIKQEPLDQDEEDAASVNYLGLNPLSVMFNKNKTQAKQSEPISKTKKKKKNDRARLPVISKVEGSLTQLGKDFNVESSYNENDDSIKNLNKNEISLLQKDKNTEYELNSDSQKNDSGKKIDHNRASSPQLDKGSNYNATAECQSGDSIRNVSENKISLSQLEIESNVEETQNDDSNACVNDTSLLQADNPLSKEENNEERRKSSSLAKTELTHLESDIIDKQKEEVHLIEKLSPNIDNSIEDNINHDDSTKSSIENDSVATHLSLVDFIYEGSSHDTLVDPTDKERNVEISTPSLAAINPISTVDGSIRNGNESESLLTDLDISFDLSPSNNENKEDINQEKSHIQLPADSLFESINEDTHINTNRSEPSTHLSSNFNFGLSTIESTEKPVNEKKSPREMLNADSIDNFDLSNTTSKDATIKEGTSNEFVDTFHFGLNSNEEPDGESLHPIAEQSNNGISPSETSIENSNDILEQNSIRGPL